ncbi:MAG: S8 family serine peptidase, partial [Pseudomonadota bacterium]|nr:S8 family serine peptidase [Pseudomonadota bacterium]
MLRGSWLAVVNVTKQRVISRSSNGCGIAKDYCLAAPGTLVSSTFARGEKYDVAHEPQFIRNNRQYGDTDEKTGDGYGTFSGTSMAAPVVSGALAVLKSKDPQLTARKAVKALLCTATELRENGRAGVAKPTDDAAITTCVTTDDNGAGLTYTNGWTPSEVYGHGLVNLARALQPIGPT